MKVSTSNGDIKTHFSCVLNCAISLQKSIFIKHATTTAPLLWMWRKKEVLFLCTALGCPEIKLPPGAWLKTDGLTASIHCNQSDETWYLTCRGNKWEGKFNNCSSGILLLNAWFVHSIVRFFAVSLEHMVEEKSDVFKLTAVSNNHDSSSDPNFFRGRMQGCEKCGYLFQLILMVVFWDPTSFRIVSILVFLRTPFQALCCLCGPVFVTSCGKCTTGKIWVREGSLSPPLSGISRQTRNRPIKCAPGAVDLQLLRMLINESHQWN